MNNKEWTKKDDGLIRELGPKISIQRLAVRLKRSESSIKTRAKALGVVTTKVARLKYRERLAY